MVGRLDLQDFKEHAEWRRGKAQQYPNEERNLEAAAILDRVRCRGFPSLLPQLVGCFDPGGIDVGGWGDRPDDLLIER